jgi:hypothetical protein
LSDFHTFAATTNRNEGADVSATLGPIHHVMYERIGLAAVRQKDLHEFATARMSPGQREQLAAAWTLHHQPPAGDLAELIAAAPIHAWLLEQMESLLLSESQLWALLADRPERAAQVRARLHEHGVRLGEALLTEDPLLATDARRLLAAVERVLLQSMPCDPVSQVLASSERAFILRRDLLFHQSLWRHAGLAGELALELHGAWMAGLMDALPGVRFTRTEVTAGGRRLFDDRLTMAAAAVEA